MSLPMTETVARYVKTGILFALLWVATYFYTSCGIRKAVGADMQPAVAPESMNWVLCKERAPEQLATGDVVFYQRNVTGVERNVFLARVIGKPGDRVRLEKGEPYVNGSKADVPNAGKTEESIPEFIVPRDTIYV